MPNPKYGIGDVVSIRFFRDDEDGRDYTNFISPERSFSDWMRDTQRTKGREYFVRGKVVGLSYDDCGSATYWYTLCLEDPDVSEKMYRTWVHELELGDHLMQTYKIDQKWVGKLVKEARETWIVPVNAIPSRREEYKGMNCAVKVCNTLNKYAVPNQPDGTHICYGCRDHLRSMGVSVVG